MQYHDVANLFPLMDGDEYAALVADIREHGQREPIWTYEGKIIDGRNRYRACADLSIEPLIEEWNGRGSLVAFVVSMNLRRRHLSSSQKAVIAVEVEKYLAEENRPGRPSNEEMCQKIDTFSGRNAEQAARLTGTNRQYVSDAKKIAQDAPELLDEVREGTLTIPEAKALARLPETERASAIDKIASGEVSNVTKALTELRNERKAAAVTALPSDVYNVIYADPPWEYDNTGVHGAAGHHYPTMPIDEIANLLDDTRLRVADNAVLFLWVTNPILDEAFYVVNSWGFKYKTNIVWVKTDLAKPGSGFYVRGRHELLLICTRGSFTPLDGHISPPIGSVITAPVQEHSRKPDEAYDIIERLYPQCRYIELFARRRRKGWDVYGNEHSLAA